MLRKLPGEGDPASPPESIAGWRRASNTFLLSSGACQEGVESNCLLQSSLRHQCPPCRNPYSRRDCSRSLGLTHVGHSSPKHRNEEIISCRGNGYLWGGGRKFLTKADASSGEPRMMIHGSHPPSPSFFPHLAAFLPSLPGHEVSGFALPRI